MKGQKTGGRAKGTPNRNKINREWLNELLEANRGKLEKEFKKLSGKDFCFMYEKLFSYVTPKINIESVDFNKMSESELNALCNTITANITNAVDEDEDQDEDVPTGISNPTPTPSDEPQSADTWTN